MTDESSQRSQEGDVPDPSVSDLVNSVVDAGRDLNLEIMSDSAGSLWITGRRGSPVSPPVAFMFTEDSLIEYYRSIAGDPGRGELSPWEWWMTLMSTHLYEALYKMDRIGKPCFLVIDATGFTASAADNGT
ncbi:hypothetical protein [Nocardia niwae]|uniref:Uncharacterized protein n=1 Tax=Nocardia niwae TaxID=626084 RepID=A0ABV2XJ63_9NOCA